MTDKIRIPRRVNRAIKLFGYFTVKDLLRLAVPVGLIYFVFSPTALTLEAMAVVGGALLTSGIWFAVRPYDQYLDKLLFHAGRFLVLWRLLPLIRKLPVLEQEQESNVDSVETGYITADDGALISIFEVSPNSLESMSQDQQGVVHSRFKELYNTISFPIYLYSRQQPLDISAYTESIEEKNVPNEDLKQDYISFLEGLSNSELTATRHFIVVRAQKAQKHWLQENLPERIAELLPITLSDSQLENEAQVTTLQDRCRTVRRSLSSSLEAEGLAGEELEDLAEEFSNRDPNYGITATTRPSEDGGEEYRKTAYIHEFATDQRLGWPLDLLRLNGEVDIVQRVEPKKSSKANKKLERLKEKMVAEIASYVSSGRLGTHIFETVEEDIDWMMNLLADGEDRIVDYSASVTAHDEDWDRCTRIFDDITQRLETKQVRYRVPAFRTDHIRKTESPVHGRGLHAPLIMPAGSAAAGFPFATQEASEQGVVHGVDSDDQSPVLLDRFNWDAGHMIRMGKTGGGKSYAQKIELLRTVLAFPELNIFIVDPKSEREYAALIARLGGNIQTLGADAEHRFDSQYLCFDVGDGGQKDIAAAMTNAVQQIHQATTELNQPTLVVIDEAHNMTETDSGLRALSKFIREARSTETAVTMLTQSASDFTRRTEGRTILDNTPAKIFMNHIKVRDSTVNYFDLSTGEKEDILDLETGDKGYSEAIVTVSGQLDTRIEIEATDEEHRVIEELEAAEVEA